nr:MAG TPA: hypothetical protein [Caudoviricetes sp.]
MKKEQLVELRSRLVVLHNTYLLIILLLLF